ncbi:MAG: phosphoglucosamine mutase [Sedimentisphaerales bacterium]|nr:phosphoglucosamine mutase [Sedimentisphaerales bacterium]
MAPLIISISGVRGIVGETLGAAEAVVWGQAYGTFLRYLNGDKRPTVCIGRDSRPSGSMLAAGLAAGLMATGCEVVQLGIVTTPGAALMTRFLKADGGVVLTASHNPIEWNGIKFLRHDGIAYPAEQARQIHRHYHDKQFRLEKATNTGKSREESRTHAVHIDTVLQYCDVNLVSSRRFKAVLDSINGAGCFVTANLLSRLGCNVVHINDQPTGLFAHTPEPTAENLADLGAVVKKHKADIGFAQDPDADRLALIDETGRYIGEEYTLALAAKYVFRKKTGKAAANLSTSRMIDDIAASAGGEVIRTPVGEAHVANAMLEHHCIIGGEGNGGVIDPRVVPVRDSLVGISMVLQLMAETNKTVSELVAEIPRYCMIKTKFACPQEKTAAVLDSVMHHYRQAGKDMRIDTRDGIRIDGPRGWVQLRASNTEPIMRIMAEAGEETVAQQLIADIKNIAGV